MTIPTEINCDPTFVLLKTGWIGDGDRVQLPVWQRLQR
jgi:hypothetical protein